MAYAAVQSLLQLLEINDTDPNWYLHNKHQIKSLRQVVNCLRDFLEEFSVSTSEAVKDLEIKIRCVAYNTEDIIESYVCDQLLSESDAANGEMRYQTFCQDLEKAFKETSLIHEEAMKIRSNLLELNFAPAKLRNWLPVDRSRLKFSGEKATMVRFDDGLMKIKDWLTSSSSKLEVLSIVGMGGIGKTTLARHVFDEPLIVYRFDTRSWVTVSQEYQVREIFAGLLQLSTSELSQERGGKLAERLYKSLKGRRYLIVMDDLWETKVWDGVKRFFPDDNNGSRIILTTRLTEVGASGNHVLNLSFLSSRDSWNLLCKKVFGEESCPLDLVEIGQEIARYCRGLPLSIVVVGGLLCMDKTVGYWTTIASSMSSLLAMDGDQCLEILSLSYNHLPAHLKPCFLYFAAFPEDYKIRKSKLTKLWVAEGFIKPEKSVSLEDIAERYLEDLVNRSLIMGFKLKYSGKVKVYIIHDLLRDFCILEAQKKKFLHVFDNVSIHHEGMQSERRVSIQPNLTFENFLDSVHNSNGLALLTRSLRFFSSECLLRLKLVHFRLLRVLDMEGDVFLDEFPIDIVGLVHLRYLSIASLESSVPTSLSSICNLQTLVISWFSGYLPRVVWEMPHLRHVQIADCFFTDPPITNFVTLTNLQTFSNIACFRFTEEVIKRLPRLKKLEVLYEEENEEVVTDWPDYHLSNIVRLNELETLLLVSSYKIAFPPNFKFPSSLKKLTLDGCFLPWEGLMIAGSLPNLEALMLWGDACEGEVWEPNEGEFSQLKHLHLESLDLVHWRADDSHFPKLKCLKIERCFKLQEIPIEIGDIQSLEMMELDDGSPSAVASAKLIIDQQQSFGNDVLLLCIKHCEFIPKEFRN